LRLERAAAPGEEAGSREHGGAHELAAALDQQLAALPAESADWWDGTRGRHRLGACATKARQMRHLRDSN